MKMATLARKLLVFSAAAAFAVSGWSLRAEDLDQANPSLSRHRTPLTWTGYNKNLSSYFVYWGYPSYSPHPRFLGSLTGSWQQIGEQYGRGAGDLIRMVFEGYFMEKVQTQAAPRHSSTTCTRSRTTTRPWRPRLSSSCKGWRSGPRRSSTSRPWRAS